MQNKHEFIDNVTVRNTWGILYNQFIGDVITNFKWLITDNLILISLKKIWEAKTGLKLVLAPAIFLCSKLLI